MKKGIFLLVVCLLPYLRSAPAALEMVWLKDVTTSFQTDKRALGELDLPDDLTFHLSRGSHALTLNLKRNNGIDPNADIYVVRKLKDGQPLLEKTRNLEKEDVAYYQDRENGAFMIVRCVKRSDGQYDRDINGFIRIENRNYELRPAETDVSSRNFLEVPDLLGKRYVLHDQANIQREMSVKKKDAELINLLRSFPHGQNNQNHFPLPNSTSSSRNVAGLHNRDNRKQDYNVEITVLLDSEIWDFYSSLAQTNRYPVTDKNVQKNIRKAFSHVMNGVNLLYKEIEDASIQISVTIRKFDILQKYEDFRHKNSVVQTVGEKKYIDAYKYLNDLADWANIFGSYSDHVMLFTRYGMHNGNISYNEINGLSYTGMVCDKSYKTSIVMARGDFIFTVGTAAHELGHNLGAEHDGEGNATACKAEDMFIMSPNDPDFGFDKTKPYSRNPWMFSNCSVEAFKKTLKNKQCLNNKGVFYSEKEWKKFVKKMPGEEYTLNQQCEHMNGRKSTFYGTVSEDICRFMKCTDPKTGLCIWKFFVAARGTKCGENMWCMEGRCVSKASK